MTSSELGAIVTEASIAIRVWRDCAYNVRSALDCCSVDGCCDHAKRATTYTMLWSDDVLAIPSCDAIEVFCAAL